MATREENLKKLNEELEKMSDEELEEIAGGVFVEYLQNVVDTNAPEILTDEPNLTIQCHKR